MTVAGEIMPTLRQLASVDFVKILAPDGSTEHARPAAATRSRPASSPDGAPTEPDRAPDQAQSRRERAATIAPIACSRAYTGSVPAALDLLVGPATAAIACATPSPVQPASCPRALRTWNGAMPEVAGDVVRPYGARAPAHARQVAQARGEGGVDRHRVGAGGQRVAEQPQRLLVAPLDRGVGHLEAAHLDPAGVVALDHGAVDGALGVGDQLAAGVGQLAQVAAEGVDQRGRGVVADPAVRPA